MRGERAERYATRALERAQERKRRARSGPPAARAGAIGPPRTELFQESLVVNTFPVKQAGRWLTVPAAGVVHLLVIAALIAAPWFLPVETVEPPVVLLFFNPAPPPPPPPLQGTPLVTEKEDVRKPQEKEPDPEKKTFEEEKK
ncbi:MAG: hypothetical protein L0191_18560, partial [Acidobacteria bacterium]|nr:hypothetical protein [Acidobacteriota bacterium]